MQQFGSVADLARAVGVSDNAIYKWVSGRGQPSVASVVQLARAAHVSIEWLATGSDAASTDAQGSEDFVFMSSQTVRERGSRVTIRSNQIVDHLAMRASWMREHLNADPANVLLFQARGDSMAPTITDGDLMIVDRREGFFRHDGLYVIAMTGELAVKRLQRRPDGKIAIRSDNPSYDVIVVAAETLDVIGDVIWLSGALPRTLVSRQNLESPPR